MIAISSALLSDCDFFVLVQRWRAEIRAANYASIFVACAACTAIGLIDWSLEERTLTYFLFIARCVALCERKLSYARWRSLPSFSHSGALGTHNISARHTPSIAVSARQQY